MQNIELLLGRTDGRFSFLYVIDALRNRYLLHWCRYVIRKMVTFGRILLLPGQLGFIQPKDNSCSAILRTSMESWESSSGGCIGIATCACNCQRTRVSIPRSGQYQFTEEERRWQRDLGQGAVCSEPWSFLPLGVSWRRNIGLDGIWKEAVVFPLDQPVHVKEMQALKKA